MGMARVSFPLPGPHVQHRGGAGGAGGARMPSLQAGFHSRLGLQVRRGVLDITNC